MCSRATSTASASHGPRAGGAGLHLVCWPNAACADHCAVTDGDSREDDGPATDPDVASDTDRAAEFEARLSLCGIPGMVCRQYLSVRADLGEVTDRYFHNVQNDATEIQEHNGAQAEIEAVVAVERRPDGRARASRREPFYQQPMS